MSTKTPYFQNSFNSYLSLECIIYKEQSSNFSFWCHQLSLELNLKIEMNILIQDIPTKVNHKKKVPAQLKTKQVQRNSQIRILANCVNDNGKTFQELYFIGLNKEIDSIWQMTAFMSQATYYKFKYAIVRLALNPFIQEKGSIEKTIFPLHSLHQKCLKNNIQFLIPKNLNKIKGRILWIDTNIHTDTILDPYGLSILNEIARSNLFLGTIISPFLDFISPIEELVQFVKTFQPDLIGFSVRNIDDVVSIRSQKKEITTIDTSNYFIKAKELKQSIDSIFKGPILLGGAALTRTPLVYMKEMKIEFGIKGSGEEKIQQLFHLWNPNNTQHNTLDFFREIWNNIDGTIHLNSNKTLNSKDSNETQKLYNNELTVVQVPRNPFKLWYEKRLGIPTAVRGSYGCPLNCSYCLEATPNKKVLKRAVTEIVAEMEWLYNEYGISQFHLTDSEANLPFSKIHSLGLEINRRKLGSKFSWTLYCTPSPWKIETLPMLIDAGLKHLKISVDHFSDTQLKSLGRLHKEHAIRHLLDSCINLKSELKVSCSVLFGAPGESKKSINYAADLMKEYALSKIIFYYSVGVRIYPGTKLFENWKSKKFDRQHLFGPGLNDQGISPLFYCQPFPPRLLNKVLIDQFSDSPSIRGIESDRSTNHDHLLRLISATLSQWSKANMKAVDLAIKNLNINHGPHLINISNVLMLEEKIRTSKYNNS